LEIIVQEYKLKTTQGDVLVRTIPDSLIAKLSANNLGSLIHLEVKDLEGRCIAGDNLSLQLGVIDSIERDLQDISGIWRHFLPSLKPSDEKVFLKGFRFFQKKFFYRFVLGEKKMVQLIDEKDLWTGHPFLLK
jgi:hypothetical protein